jgi:hypothetical protein
MDLNTFTLLMGSAGSAVINATDVFSPFLYTGNGGTQTVTNGISLSGKGGLVWIKNRGSATASHVLTDTVRGANYTLVSSEPLGQQADTSGVNSFNSTGFAVTGTNETNNANGNTFISWTFRETPKFFDIVTYTGTGANRTIAHDLGSQPGCILVKRTDTAAAWQIYHRGIANTEYLVLNTTAAKATGATRWNSTSPTSSVFSLGTATTVNASGGTYVAYIFAHNAGGFGASGTANVINCGTYTGNGTGMQIDCGFTTGARFIMIKRTDSTSNWFIWDTARGISSSNDPYLLPDLTAAEVTNTNYLNPYSLGFEITSTAFTTINASGGSFIYLAIA